MARASEKLLAEEPRRAREQLASDDTVGGLHGDVSTADAIRFRNEYNRYVMEFTGPDSERLAFAEWVRQRKAAKSAE